MFFFGVDGPNAPIELGVKNWRSKLREVSSALTKPPILRFQASKGFDSAVAESNAAICIIVSAPKSFASVCMRSASITSSISKGPFSTTGESVLRISVAKTLSAPYILRNFTINSDPI